MQTETMYAARGMRCTSACASTKSLCVHNSHRDRGCGRADPIYRESSEGDAPDIDMSAEFEFQTVSGDELEDVALELEGWDAKHSGWSRNKSNIVLQAIFE